MENIMQQVQEQNDIESEHIDDAVPTSKGLYNPGDPITFVRVRFPGNAKSHPFHLGKRKFNYGQKVMAMSDRGMTVGYINSFPYQLPFDEKMLPLKTISKVATEEDLLEQRGLAEKERSAEKICLDLIEKYKLEMILTHVEFINFGKKAVFYFTAPERVDFRQLVKELVQSLKKRIELRQISLRDRSAAIGAVGPCGLQTCCSSFLSSYGSVSIKMAKNQNLALIPNKINGVCGQLKCCIRYEDEVYSQKRSQLPQEGKFVQLANGDIGKVTRLHVLKEQFEILTDRGVFRKYAQNQFDKKKSQPPEGWSFPNRLDHIVNETDKVIGGVEVVKKEDPTESLFETQKRNVEALDHTNNENASPSEKDNRKTPHKAQKGHHRRRNRNKKKQKR